MQEEFSKFKDIIIHKLFDFQKEINNKLALSWSEVQNIVSSNNQKQEIIWVKINEIENTITKDKVQIDYIHGLMKFKDDCSERMIKHDVKIGQIQTDLKAAITKYDKIYFDNLYLPGLIGESNCKFKNMKEYIDYNLNHIGHLNSAKDTQTIDLRYLRERFDNIIKNINSQIESSEKGVKIYTKCLNENSEKNFKQELENFTRTIGENKLENHRIVQELKKNSIELKNETDKIHVFKNEILAYLDSILINLKGQLKISKSDFKNESEILNKENKIKRNSGPEVIKTKLPQVNEESEKKSNNKKITLKNSFYSKKPSKNDDDLIESFVKKYIKGEPDKPSKLQENISDKFEPDKNIKVHENILNKAEICSTNNNMEINRKDHETTDNMNNIISCSVKDEIINKDKFWKEKTSQNINEKMNCSSTANKFGNINEQINQSEKIKDNPKIIKFGKGNINEDFANSKVINKSALEYEKNNAITTPNFNSANENTIAPVTLNSDKSKSLFKFYKSVNDIQKEDNIPNNNKYNSLNFLKNVQNKIEKFYDHKQDIVNISYESLPIDKNASNKAENHEFISDFDSVDHEVKGELNIGNSLFKEKDKLYSLQKRDFSHEEKIFTSVKERKKSSKFPIHQEISTSKIQLESNFNIEKINEILDEMRKEFIIRFKLNEKKIIEIDNYFRKALDSLEKQVSFYFRENNISYKPRKAQTDNNLVSVDVEIPHESKITLASSICFANLKTQNQVSSFKISNSKLNKISENRYNSLTPLKNQKENRNNSVTSITNPLFPSSSNGLKNQYKNSRSKDNNLDKINYRETYPEKFFKVKYVVFNRIIKK